MRDDRGVSEILGYVFVFGIITATIAIVFTGGLTGLQDMQQFEQDQNMERAFDVLHDNVADIQRGDAPSRATEMRLADGVLRGGESATMYLNVTDDENVSTEMRPVPLTYANDGTQVSYEGGGVFWDDGRNSVMLAEPNWIVTDDRLVIPYTWTRQGGPDQVSGPGTFLVVAEERTHETALQYGHDDPNEEITVEIWIESERADAWGQYLAEQGFDAEETVEDNDPNVIGYEIDIDQVFVQRVVIDMEVRH